MGNTGEAVFVFWREEWNQEFHLDMINDKPEMPSTAAGRDVE